MNKIKGITNEEKQIVLRGLYSKTRSLCYEYESNNYDTWVKKSEFKKLNNLITDLSFIRDRIREINNISKEME